ncbi:MAG: LapA family protein [Bacteroidia bacterium]|nr:LapA family protein [Bacteroidia bacterium]
MNKKLPIRRLLITGLILAIFLVIFTLINNERVTISLLFASVEIPLALVIILMIFIGVVLGIMVSLPAAYRKNREIRHLKGLLEACEKKKSGSDSIFTSENFIQSPVK